MSFQHKYSIYWIPPAFQDMTMLISQTNFLFAFNYVFINDRRIFPQGIRCFFEFL